MRPLRTTTFFICITGFLYIFGCPTKPPDTPAIQFAEEFVSFTQMAQLPLSDLPKREAWQKAAPQVVEISIPRESGERDQPALWYHSGTEMKKPLLLALHSWSADYLQHDGIPYAVFAEKNDWIFLHPNYRGRFDDEESTGSEKAVRDVLDALSYAKNHAPVDEDRIYLAGFSGGAMMSLIMVGRYPLKFTAALAWVPVYDLNDWYAHVALSKQHYAQRYRVDIEASCGGKPPEDERAKNECAKRSPSAYLANARDAGVKVFIGGGIEDHFVPPSQAIRAFNDLAAEGDKISEADYLLLDKTERLPERLTGEAEKNRFFEAAGLPIVFKRASKNVTLVLFDGGHNVVYNAGLEWLAQQHQ